MNDTQAALEAAHQQGCNCEPTVLGISDVDGIKRVQLGHDDDCPLLRRQTDADDETVVIYRP